MKLSAFASVTHNHSFLSELRKVSVIKVIKLKMYLLSNRIIFRLDNGQGRRKRPG